MGIDRIGKGGGTVPEVRLPDEGAAGAAARPATAFGVKPTEAAQPAAAVTSPALEGVRSGALDVHGYIDAKVDEATAHLSHLAPEQLEGIRAIVREQLTRDPHLIELVQHATGKSVPASDEST